MARIENQFSFVISLSVLNHLGRNLYRSFMTVLGEAISNSWDADAENVWIYIDKEKNFLIIKDDGDGMSAEDFQNKFLKIGYSKRKDGSSFTRKGRPFIGRKGIGKLALLSCADRISVLSKTPNSPYVGGVIDNSGLDQAITDDLTPQQYQLGLVDYDKFEKFVKHHNQGTILHFENIKEGIRNSAEQLKKLIALYFRFSLLDDSFNIWFDEEKITYENLAELASKTQFLWYINKISDPYLGTLENLKNTKIVKRSSAIKGFVASVETPRDLKVYSTEEKIGVDLFVNGRLRVHKLITSLTSAILVT